MTRKVLAIGAATAFVVASFGAWAAGPNDGPKYPNMTSNKHYTDQRIMDHNNAAPRYAVTSNPHKHYTDQRIMDHNNGAPRYAVTTTSPRRVAGVRTIVRTASPHVLRSTHVQGRLAHHG